MKRAHLLSVVLFALFPGLVAEARAAPEKAYTFGVVPQFEQRKLYAIWKPIIEDMEKRTGFTLNLVMTLSMQDFERGFGRGDFDFVYVNPYHLVRLHETLPYVTLLADETPIRGIVVVRKDSTISKPADLDGKTVAFPSPNALAATLLVRSDLEQIHHLSVTPMYVTTHSSVYLHVAKGLAAAGGGAEKTFQEQDESVRSQLRVIYTTRSCPSHPIVAHPRVPKDDREKIRRALLDMGETAKGKEMLWKVPIQKLVPVTYDDYAIMQRWGLEKYWQPVQERK